MIYRHFSDSFISGIVYKVKTFQFCGFSTFSKVTTVIVWLVTVFGDYIIWGNEIKQAFDKLYCARKIKLYAFYGTINHKNVGKIDMTLHALIIWLAVLIFLPFCLTLILNVLNPLSANVVYARHDDVTCSGCSASYRQSH